MLKYETTGPPTSNLWGEWLDMQLRANASYWGACTQHVAAMSSGFAHLWSAPAQIGEAFARSLRISAIASRVNVTRRRNVFHVEWLAKTGPTVFRGDATIIAFPGHFHEHH